jgi:hypothetical protein
MIEGAIFAVAYLAYATMTPTWGYLLRKIQIDFRWVLLGPVFAGAIWMVLGPIPGFDFIKSEYVTCFCSSE